MANRKDHTALRIAQVNLAFDPAIPDPRALLRTYHTLTGWSRALARAGARVHVAQRFTADAEYLEDGVTYRFVADGGRGMSRPWDRNARTVADIRRMRPDVVHVNGLMFPGTVRALRAALGPLTPIVLQDHSGALPRRLPWPAGPLARARWRHALRAATACSFTARELALRWQAVGLPRNVPLLEIPEASTDVVPIDRRDAIELTGMRAALAILWVGRLDANKDPLTALDVFERALPDLPGARVWMVFRGGPLESHVSRRINSSSGLRDRVVLVGEVAPDRMSAFYSAADLFVSASRHEGSGYALLEALACGVSPCVTEIPSFRVIAGPCGSRWRVGDAVAGSDALVQLGRCLDEGARARVRDHFRRHLSWDVIAARTASAYRALTEAS